ncbi:MAG: DUF438 domain-containing protein [Clostridiales bacterium]|nr:DUF438 domain-containing protein [Clostridiales bacterium]
MSEHINNREYRQRKLKSLIKRLHDGATVEEVQDEFNKLTIGVTPTEITEMEQALVNEGMPIEDIQRLCDVHAAVFKGSIEDIHKDDVSTSLESIDGHPIHTLKKENRAIEVLLEKSILEKLYQLVKDKNDANKKAMLNALNQLMTIEKHYSRKENLLFPYMEKYNITAPPQVMWGVDDEIRGKIKFAITNLKSEGMKIKNFSENVKELVNQVSEMIFKEEEIMFPMILEKFTQDEWANIEKSSAEIGFTLIDSVTRWIPKTKIDTAPIAKETQSKQEQHIKAVLKDSQTLVQFDAGSMSSEEINAVLNTVPLDMTFVDANNRVKYFTQGKERVFDRPITIIGREVKHCHPPKSVHVVEQIVKDLRSGKKDNEDFWIKMGEMFVYIRYFAVRNKKGEFLGTLEVTQNIKSIIELEGEKRLMS